MILPSCGAETSHGPRSHTDMRHRLAYLNCDLLLWKLLRLSNEGADAAVHVRLSPAQSDCLLTYPSMSEEIENAALNVPTPDPDDHDTQRCYRLCHRSGDSLLPRRRRISPGKHFISHRGKGDAHSPHRCRQPASISFKCSITESDPKPER